MTTPICTIDETGIHRPTYEECQDYIRSAYRGIYGQDIVFAPEDRDTQFLDLIALALHDVNGETVAAYHRFDPGQAVGTGLSSLVKLNGITRDVPSLSTVTVTVSGVVGTEIENGIVTDDNGNQWNLPTLVVIPPEGQVNVTATAAEAGSIRAPAGTVRGIFTPVVGWQSVDNFEASSPGAPVELDALLRQRQAFSASLPALSSEDGIRSALAAIPGVQRYRLYENDHAGVDDLGIPGRSIAVVVDGGDVQTIVDTIALKKGTGVGTYGTDSALTTPTSEGRVKRISYSYALYVPVTYAMDVRALSGFTSSIRDSIKSTLAAWTIDRAIGERISLADAFSAARLFNAAEARTFEIVPGTFTMARDRLPTAVQDVEFAYNEVADCISSFVDIRIVT